MSASQWLGFSLALITRSYQKIVQSREYVHIHACIVGSVLNDEFLAMGISRLGSCWLGFLWVLAVQKKKPALGGSL